MVGIRIFGVWLLFMFLDYVMGLPKLPTFNLILAAVLVFSDEANKQAKFRKEMEDRLLSLIHI